MVHTPVRPPFGLPVDTDATFDPRIDAQFLVHFTQCALKSGLADLAVASRYLPVLPAVVVMHEKN